MKIKKIQLNNFKRFDELTIDFGETNYKLVVLVGPNGCGKSSIFDSFEQVGGRVKADYRQDESYLCKKAGKDFEINIVANKGTFTSKRNAPNSYVPKNFCYLRSAYRVDADFQVSNIQRKSEVLLDEIRPRRMIDIDRRVQDNYERLVTGTLKNVYSKQKDNLSVKELREELIGKLKESIRRVFPDLSLEHIGDPLLGGQFYFTKGTISNFPYKNLSGGEKGAFDILFDLIVKTQEFNDTVIAIDEPDLHMHSSLQQKLLNEIYTLIPEECQLWIATHSIGFIKAACDLARLHPSDVALIDLAKKDFDKTQVLTPDLLTPYKVREIFETAIDDLASMVTPSTIIICEGSKQGGTSLDKKEFDAKIYNKIFFDQDVLFLAADCKGMAQRAGYYLFEIVKKAGALKKVFSLVDKDGLTEEQIREFQSKSPEQQFLKRREIENYLFDSEILEIYCVDKGRDFSIVTNRPKDIQNDDIKPIQGAIMNQCGFTGSVEAFKMELATLVTRETNTYKELIDCIKAL